MAKAISIRRIAASLNKRMKQHLRRVQKSHRQSFQVWHTLCLVTSRQKLIALQLLMNNTLSLSSSTQSSSAPYKMFSLIDPLNNTGSCNYTKTLKTWLLKPTVKYIQIVFITYLTNITNMASQPNGIQISYVHAI